MSPLRPAVACLALILLPAAAALAQEAAPAPPQVDSLPSESDGGLFAPLGKGIAGVLGVRPPVYAMRPMMAGDSLFGDDPTAGGQAFCIDLDQDGACDRSFGASLCPVQPSMTVAAGSVGILNETGIDFVYSLDGFEAPVSSLAHEIKVLALPAGATSLALHYLAGGVMQSVALTPGRVNRLTVSADHKQVLADLQ